jgi:hypothetical protein
MNADLCLSKWVPTSKKLCTETDTEREMFVRRSTSWCLFGLPSAETDRVELFQADVNETVPELILYFSIR